ncbi:MAG: hypothetical protein J0H68_03855 [Sphingobacteriia bacterium]|nr:hypothetical protein [Sphingobacteriia bacterium]
MLIAKVQAELTKIQIKLAEIKASITFNDFLSWLNDKIVNKRKSKHEKQNDVLNATGTYIIKSSINAIDQFINYNKNVSDNTGSHNFIAAAFRNYWETLTNPIMLKFNIVMVLGMLTTKSLPKTTLKFLKNVGSIALFFQAAYTVITYFDYYIYKCSHESQQNNKTGVKGFFNRVKNRISSVGEVVNEVRQGDIDGSLEKTFEVIWKANFNTYNFSNDMKNEIKILGRKISSFTR